MSDPKILEMDISPDEFRKLGHQLIEHMAEALEAEHHDPVLEKISGLESRNLFEQDLPLDGAPPTKVLAEAKDSLLPFARHNGHPRFFGYVCSSADPVGILAEGFTAALNQNLTAWRSAPAAVEMERLVVRWLDQLIGFAGGGHGLLTSGGSAANAQALACAVARAEEKADLPEGSRHRLTVYMSREAHLCLPKAARWLGLTSEHIRKVAIDDHRRMRVDALRRQIEKDLDAGLVPVAICASAGIANTGTVDPLDEVADLAASLSLWLHIDGAYGAPAALVDDYRWMRRTFARADSLALDPHKWLYTPIDAGCVLLRSDEDSRRAFALDSEYVTVTQTDPIESFAFFHHGAELTRRFRALKIWTILKTRGAHGLSAAIAKNIALRKRLDEHVVAHPNLELLGSDLSISCFRFLPDSEVGPQRINEINRQILEALVAEGSFYMSPTTLDERYALRICIVNFRTRVSDIDQLIDEILQLGKRFASA